MKSVILAAAAAIAVVGLAPPAAADPVNMPCAADGDPLQACDGGVLTRSLPNNNRTDAWALKFTLDPNENCAPINLRWRAVPNGGPITLLGTDRLEPGQTTPVHEIINTGGSGASVELHANGIQEGCNTGSLMQWVGDLHVEQILGPA
jgi:hypothetical protein